MGTTRSEAAPTPLQTMHPACFICPSEPQVKDKIHMRSARLNRVFILQTCGKFHSLEQNHFMSRSVLAAAQRQVQSPGLSTDLWEH